ncbi:MAG TPA: methyltransferase domain-containing protein [Lunatimonas sp.]|nr:methyltransferase domain-containing protein [Lunatimonas sp.]
MIDFSKRSNEPELMDDLSCDGEILKQTLAELKTINRLLGGNKVTTDGLKKLLKRPSSGTISIADVGCGGGDMLQVMQTWGNDMGLDLEFLGIDANPHTIQLAKEKFSGNPRISFEVENVLMESFHRTPIDIVTCTLFTHHFTDEELKRMFASFIKKAKVGVVVNDLHRNPVAYYSIKYLTKFFSKSPMVIHDAPLSVQRSFTRSELYGLLDGLGFKKIEISWHWAFRWQVVCWV